MSFSCGFVEYIVDDATPLVKTEVLSLEKQAITVVLPLRLFCLFVCEGISSLGFTPIRGLLCSSTTLFV